MSPSARRAEVIRVFERYLVEVVERYDLCPWARGAREQGQVGVDVVWGTPSGEAWVAAAQAQLARPGVRVVMVIAPELAGGPAALRKVRELMVARIPSAGIADFHPESPLDLATPARLVPYLRRSPDPLIQLVPLSILDQVRGPRTGSGIATQAQMLGGLVPPSRPDLADRIAAANHTTVLEVQDELAKTLADIAEDRARSYAKVEITSSR
ncbi:MAG: hypothetical protein IPQ07_39190 [Myxococcales bacterium]|nr:hypothetical protein [Myxococcales bacterium]